MRRRGWALMLGLWLGLMTAPAAGQEFEPPARDPMMPPAGLLPEAPGFPGVTPADVAPPANAIERPPNFVG